MASLELEAREMGRKEHGCDGASVPTLGLKADMELSRTLWSASEPP